LEGRNDCLGKRGRAHVEFQIGSVELMTVHETVSKRKSSTRDKNHRREDKIRKRGICDRWDDFAKREEKTKKECSRMKFVLSKNKRIDRKTQRRKKKRRGSCKKPW